VCQKPVRFPVEGRVRFGVPGTRRSYTASQEADPGVLLGEAGFPETNPNPVFRGRDQRFSTESLILAQDERWRRA
jgi:hypothetical protein